MHQSKVVPVPLQGQIVRIPRDGQQDDTFRIATLSVPGIEGRSHKILPVLRELKGSWSLTWMLDEHERDAALALVREFGVREDRVTFVLSRTANQWTEIVSQSDLALHMHTSPFGHLAPFVQISLAHGCPVVVARSAQGEDLPEEVAFHIAPGVHESAEVQAVLLELRGGLVKACRAPGMKYAQELFDVRRVANLLSETFTEAAPHVSYVMGRWQAIGRRSRTALMKEVRGLVTAGEGDVVNAYDSVVRPVLDELGWVL